jgi:hypothetical protein
MKLLFSIIVIFIALCSCEKQPIVNPVEPKIGKGLFILNQGNFQFSNSSLSYYDPYLKQIQNNVFQRVNEIPLGDVAQCMVIHDSLAFIVLNNSGGVYVIDINNFEFKGWIEGLTSPRYIHIINEQKGYITDLYAKAITIFNPTILEITGGIATDKGSNTFNQHATEQMVQLNNLIYTNCWSFDDKILIIDTDLDKVVDSIQVGIQPVAIKLDKNNKLWVLTDGGYVGNPFGHEEAKLVCINLQNKAIEREFIFELNDRPTDLQLNGTKDTLYFVNNDIWKLSIEQRSMPEKPFIPRDNKLFYALGVDPITSEVYVSDAIDYMQSGKVYRFSPQAAPIDTFTVGITPGYFCFK